ncbi:putative reverse transcriptase domain-containing protein [Tanacetum coccineum]
MQAVLNTYRAVFNLAYPTDCLSSVLEENSEEEVAETMAETMEQYMSKTRADYGSGIARPKINDKDHFELKGHFLKELRDNTLTVSIMDNTINDQIMLRVFPMSLTGAASRWLRNKPSSSVQTWEDLKTKFLSKYCPPARTAKKMEEINNFQQEPDETLYQAWERFKELLMKYPQHYLTEMHGVAIQEMVEYSQKWHNGTSRTRSTETSDGLAIDLLPSETKELSIKLFREFKSGNDQVLHGNKDWNLPTTTKTNPRDHVKSILTTVEVDMTLIRRIESS